MKCENELNYDLKSWYVLLKKWVSFSFVFSLKCIYCNLGFFLFFLDTGSLTLEILWNYFFWWDSNAPLTISLHPRNERLTKERSANVCSDDFILLYIHYRPLVKSTLAAVRCCEICLFQREQAVRKVALAVRERKHTSGCVTSTWFHIDSYPQLTQRTTCLFGEKGKRLQAEKPAEIYLWLGRKGKYLKWNSMTVCCPFTIHRPQWTVSVAWPTGMGGGHWRPVWPWASSWGCSSAPGYLFSSPTWHR